MFGFASDTGDSWQVTLCNIGLFGSSEIIHCDELQDTFILKEGANITIDLDNATKTVTFSASGTGSGPNELYCTVGKWFNAFNATTNNFNCETVPTFSDATTASNVGTGEGVFNIEVGDDLRFNSLIGGQGIDAVNTVNDITISTDFKIDTLPTIDIDQFISAFDNSTGDWTTKTFSVNTLSPNNDIFITGINNVTGLITTNQFSVNTITCSGSDRVSAINNVTGLVTCSAGGGAGITSINGDTTGAQVIAGSANEITIGDVGATHTIDVGTDIVQIDQSNTYSGSNTQSFGSNILTFNSDPADAGNIRHQNAGQECWEASPTGTDQCIGNDATENYVWDANWNNIDFGSNAFINAIFDVAGTGNRLTSTGTALGDILKSDGTDFKRLARGTANQVLAVNAGGTDIAWTTLSSNGGSGIPLPPKKWGELIPRSASVDTIGLVAGCSILATASYVYDTTDNSNAILSSTGVTDGINGGIHCSGTNYNSFRGDQNAYMYSKVEWNKITTNRIFVGFQSGATHLPNNADTILDNLSGYGLCIRTSDTLIQECRNDGDATTDYASTGITETADTVYAIEVYAKSGGTSWCYKINGSAESCQTTEIPATTTRLYPNSTGETDGGATAILWTQYLWYLQSDK